MTLVGSRRASHVPHFGCDVLFDKVKTDQTDLNLFFYVLFDVFFENVKTDPNVCERQRLFSAERRPGKGKVSKIYSKTS